MSAPIRRLAVQLGRTAPAYLPGAPQPVDLVRFEQWLGDRSNGRRRHENCTLFWMDFELWGEQEIRVALQRLRKTPYSTTLLVRQAMTPKLAEGFHLELFQGGLLSADDTLLVALDEPGNASVVALESLAGVGKTQFPLVLALPTTPGEAPRHPVLQSRLINARGVGVYLFDPGEGLFVGAAMDYWPAEADD